MTPPTPMQPAPGRHVTRRLAEPKFVGSARNAPDCNAEALVECHNAAVKLFGSDCGGFHAYHYIRSETAGVFDGSGGFPADAVVTPLAWGRIDPRLAQAVLEHDGY